MALNDTTQALPQVGSDVGGFLTGLAPGLVEFIFNLAIIGGVVGIFYGIVAVVKKYAK